MQDDVVHSYLVDQNLSRSQTDTLTQSSRASSGCSTMTSSPVFRALPGALHGSKQMNSFPGTDHTTQRLNSVEHSSVIESSRVISVAVELP